MSISSSSDCFFDSHLLCDEDSSGILSGDLLEYSSDLESAASSEDSIASFIEDERHFVPGIDYLSRFQSQSLDSSARADSVAWILKVFHSIPILLSSPTRLISNSIRLFYLYPSKNRRRFSSCRSRFIFFKQNSTIKCNLAISIPIPRRHLILLNPQ